MGASSLIDNLNRLFSADYKNNQRYRGLQRLLKKLKQKEAKINYKHQNETNADKRKKQQRALSVIHAQMNKTQKLLNI